MHAISALSWIQHCHSVLFHWMALAGTGQHQSRPGKYATQGFTWCTVEHLEGLLGSESTGWHWLEPVTTSSGQVIRGNMQPKVSLGALWGISRVYWVQKALDSTGWNRSPPVQVNRSPPVQAGLLREIRNPRWCTVGHLEDLPFSEQPPKTVWFTVLKKHRARICTCV